jgi:hypothetical protein
VTSTLINHKMLSKGHASGKHVRGNVEEFRFDVRGVDEHVVGDGETGNEVCDVGIMRDGATECRGQYHVAGWMDQRVAVGLSCGNQNPYASMPICIQVW